MGDGGWVVQKPSDPGLRIADQDRDHQSVFFPTSNTIYFEVVPGKSLIPDPTLLIDFPIAS
jgi:hypothetical protein